MKLRELIKIAGQSPIIETPMLVKRPSDVSKIEVQLSRWVKLGVLSKVRRGVYLLAEPYRKQTIDYDYLATLIHRPSYISLEYALADYGLIPEAIHAITLITTKRPYKLIHDNKLIIYRHVKKSLFWGFVARGKKYHETFYAEPEKALLDLFYFTTGKITMDFLRELRLQNLEILNPKKVLNFAKLFNSTKINHAAKLLCKCIDEQKGLKEL